MDSQAPKYRPSERFWPYAELTEQPSEEELAAIDPDLYEALYGSRPGPFSITLVFPTLDIPAFPRALEISRAAAEYRHTGTGCASDRPMPSRCATCSTSSGPRTPPRS